MRDYREFLRDILDSIEQIEGQIGRDKTAFEQNRLLQTWAIHHLQVIGEAASQLPVHVRASNPQIPWRDMVAMRNILVHRYFGIDLEEVWSAVNQELPILKRAIVAMVGSLDEP